MASKAPTRSEGSMPTSTSGSSLASSSGSGSLSEKRRPSALAFWEHRARKVSGASTPDPASANNDNVAAAASTSASLPFLKAGLVRANSLALSSRSSSGGGAGAGAVAAPSSPSQGSSSDRTSMQSRRSQSTVRADEGGSARASTEWNAGRTSTEQRKVATPTIVGLDEEVAAQDRRLSAERRRLNNEEDEASSLLDVTHAQHGAGAGAGVVLVNRKADYEADDLGAGGLSMRSYEAFFPEPGSSGASSSSARSSRISARSTEQGAETSGELTAGSSGQSQHRASSERARGETEVSNVQARGTASAAATSVAMTPSHSATSLASTSSSSRARAVSCLDARLSPSQPSHRDGSAHRLSASSRARHERGGSSTPRSRRGSKDVSGASSPLLHASSSAGSMERATHSRSHSLLASLDGRMGGSRTLLEGTAYSSDEEDDALHDDRASSTVSPTGSATGRDAAARERRKRRLLKSQIRKRQSRRRSASLRSATGALALEDELSDDFAESGSSEGAQEELGHVRGSTSFDEADDEVQLARLAPQHAQQQQQQQQRRRRLSTPATVRNNDEALLTTSLGIGGARNSSADRAVTPGGVSTGSDSFYDANLSSPSSSASSPSHSTLEAASLHAHDASTSAHRLGCGRSKERTVDESHEATAAWLNVSPRPTEMNSSATLRQDALDGESRREPSLAASAGHALPSIPSPNGSSAGTPPTDWGVASFRSPESSGTMSSAITASTTVSSTRGASLDLSPPVSPLSPNSSFMASFVGHSPRIFSSGIAGAANTKAGELRASRIAALPPPRPTPTSPLPPPPQSGFAAQQQQRPAPAPPPQPLFVERRARSSDASQSRLRSQSLSQAAAGLTITAGSGGGTYEQERGAVSAGLGVGAEPMMRSRSNSQVPSKARASASRDAAASAAGAAAASTAGGALLIPQARPPLSRRSSSSTASAMPLPPTAEEVPSLPSSPAAPQPATLGPSGTIRGRPRGATVGAVPAASSTSARFTVPTRTRPRSMLSHEITHESQQQQQGFEASQLAASSPSALGAPSAGTTIASRRASMSTSSQSVTTGETSLATPPTTTASSATDSALARRGLTLVTQQQQQQAVVMDAATTAPRSSTSSSSAAGASLGGGGVGAGTSTSHSGGGGAGAGEGRSSGGGSGSGARSRSGSNASLLQQVQYPPKSHASFVIAVVGHHGAGKSTVIKKGLRQFGLSKPNVLSEKIASHSTICIVDQEQRTIEVLEMDASVLLNGPSKRFAWPKFLPHIDAVILCYDASQISSFRGMSELLENFAIHDLSTVMLACKSEIFPKAVDPYYASDMAAVYNVGLAECSVQSEEGKKRMRDCFSYLVKEVAKARAGRRAPAESSSAAGGAGSMPPLLGSGMRKLSDATTASMDSRASSISQQPSPTLSSGGFSSPGGEGTSSLARIIQSTHLAGQDVRNTSRKMSDATTASADAPSYVGSNSEDEVALQHSISKAQLGLQSAKSVGGYVTIEALWEKLFFAAVSGDDERFLLMFMVFYRGFARPIDLLRQLIARFDALAHSERSDGVMIRFSLMRLTAMLGDWMQDYPGDLSAPETFGELYKFFDRLLQHPSTMHIASPLQQHLEMVRNAPDPDAAWSKNQDNDKPRSVAADVPPVRPALADKKLSGMDGVTPGLESFQDMTRLRAYSDTSAVSVAQSEASGSQGSRAHNAAVENRQRSASDLTSSSDGQHGGVSTSQVALPSSSASSTVQSSSVAASSSDGFSPATPAPAAPLGDSASSRKLALRSVSNAIGDMDEEVIAAELTRIEWGLFCAIRPRDLLRHILVARELRERNGPVARSIAHFNYISYWVCSMILVQGKTKHRARMLEKFMSVAAILRHSNNYNTLHAVLAGLGNASIHRLKHTRELLNGKAVNKIYLSLARLMGSDRSFAAYRMALENSEGRTIPYLGVHLQDILSTSDGNPSKRASDGMIHWRKFSLMDEAVMAIVRCQSYDRPTARPNVMVEKLIVDLPVMDEEDLYQRSLQVEPRASQSNSSLASTKIKEFFHAN